MNLRKRNSGSCLSKGIKIFFKSIASHFSRTFSFRGVLESAQKYGLLQTDF